jgi:hypothetical protein
LERWQLHSALIRRVKERASTEHQSHAQRAIHILMSSTGLQPLAPFATAEEQRLWDLLVRHNDSLGFDDSPSATMFVNLIVRYARGGHFDAALLEQLELLAVDLRVDLDQVAVMIPVN